MLLSFRSLDIFPTNPVLIMKILYSLSFLASVTPRGGRGIESRWKKIAAYLLVTASQYVLKVSLQKDINSTSTVPLLGSKISSFFFLNFS